MRIFGYELKKILNWKILLVLVLFTILYVVSTPLGNLTYSNDMYGEISVCRILLQKYGTEMDTGEQKDFEHTILPELKKEANQRLATIPTLQKTGVQDVDALDSLLQKDTDRYTEISNLIESHESKDSPFYAYENAEVMVNPLRDKQNTAAQMQKLSDFSGSDTASAKIRECIRNPNFSTLPMNIFSQWQLFISELSNLLLLSVIVVITPFLVRERRSNVRKLAYTCRKGRSLFGTQFAAAVTAVLLVILIQSLILGCTYWHDFVGIVEPFLQCRLNMIGCGLYFWRLLPFGQFMLLEWLAVILFSLGIGILSFLISRACKNYVTAIAVQLPVVWLGLLLSETMTGDCLQVQKIHFNEILHFSMDWVTQCASHLRYFEPVLCATLVLLPLAVCLVLIHREKAREML
ncbi:MAG: ABC transporter permease [Oscillospiraceae bacterium]|jgi:hypothetical protein|nr:ABC transporter permease [Oscillospiraceae bacterium]